MPYILIIQLILTFSLSVKSKVFLAIAQKQISDKDFTQPIL